MTQRVLEGKSVLITGGSRGQGAAEGDAFARAGAHVILCDVLDEEGAETARAISQAGGAAVYRHLDVASPGDWAATTEYVGGLGLGLHVLINNAGILQRDARIMNTTPEDWDRILAVNFMGAVLGIQATARLIRDSGGGAILNTGSVAGLMGHAAGIYSVSKWALRGLTKAAALELADWNIRVNAVHPSMIHTAMSPGATPFTDAMMAHTPLGRPCTVEEVAELMVFLASDAARFMTGIDIAIDGGFSELGTWWDVAQRAGLTTV